MDLLQSREVLREVVLTTFDAPDVLGEPATLLRYFALEGLDRSIAVMRGIRSLRGTLDVRGDRTTGLVRLEIRTRSPELSAQVASRFLELVNDYNLRRRQSQARAEREFVEQRLASGQQDLLAAEEALAAFYRRNRRFQDSPELMAEESRLQRVVALRQQLYLSLAQSHEAAKIEEVRNTPVITVLEHPEGFVEPRARGTTRKAAVAAILAIFFAVVTSFTLEYLRRARVVSADEYGEFVVLQRRLLARVPGRWPWARGR
jgi:uncharacterized protein involved in exopolysaccharide biosynthesis